MCSRFSKQWLLLPRSVVLRSLCALSCSSCLCHFYHRFLFVDGGTSLPESFFFSGTRKLSCRADCGEVDWRTGSCTAATWTYPREDCVVLLEAGVSGTEAAVFVTNVATSTGMFLSMSSYSFLSLSFPRSLALTRLCRPLSFYWLRFPGQQRVGKRSGMESWQRYFLEESAWEALCGSLAAGTVSIPSEFVPA